MLTLGSLFDGIGGFPLAGVMCGIRPVWSSEIEPFPLKVTAARFPDVIQLGSVTEIDGGAVRPVDIITFGSPCQDLSVAGKQLGIHEGRRSNLFFEAVRIIKEMRAADECIGRTGKHIRPRFAVWENVPGAFSSNKGADFKAVLEALAGVREDGVDVPRPKKWNTGGGILGNGWSIAWRVYDAQYWGVPQRRKRIYLVADFAGERAPEILFECEGVRGDIAAGGEAREGTAADAAGGVGGSDRVRCLNPWDCQSKQQHDINGAYPTLQAYNGGGGRCDGVCYPAAFMGGQGAKARSIAWADDGTTPTLRAAESGSNQVPDVCYKACGVDGYNTESTGDVSITIRAGKSDQDHVGCVVYRAGGYGDMEDDSLTLNTVDRRAICYPETARALTARHDSSPCVDRGQNVVCYDARGNGDGETAPTLTGDHERRMTDYTAVCIGNGQMNNISMKPIANTLDTMSDQQKVMYESDKPPRKYIVRRLTPTECARLQGFPDEWCEELGGSDSAIYKAYGNGLALPCAYDVMNRIARFVEHEKED